MFKKIFPFFILFVCSIALAQPAFKVTNGGQHPYKHKPTDLNSTNTPSNGQCVSNASATNQFTWVTCGSGGGGSGANALTGLSDVGSATITAGRLLIADGSKFQSVALSGDATISSAGAIDLLASSVGAAELSSTTVTAGSYTLASITVDGDGRLTSASNGAGGSGATSLTGLGDVGSATITAGRLLIADGSKFQSVTLSGDATISSAGAIDLLASSVGAAELSSTAVTAGSYTLASITVDGDGRLTSASNGAGGSGATSLTGLSDVGSATVSVGRLLVADGSKFQSSALVLVNADGSMTVTGNGTQGTITKGLLVNSGQGATSNDNFQVKGSSNANLVYADVANNNLLVGTTSGAYLLSVFAPDDATASGIKLNTSQANCTAADVFMNFDDTTGTEGSIACTAVAGVIGYNTFTGSHWTIVEDRQDLEILSVLCSTGKTMGEHKQLTKSKICTKRQDPAAIGVWGGKDKNDNDLILSIGTGFMNVVNKGKNIYIGDYLTSSDIKGKAEKQTNFFGQADNVYHNYTIGKSTENIIWEENEKQRRIGVIYEGG